MMKIGGCNTERVSRSYTSQGQLVPSHGAPIKRATGRQRRRAKLADARLSSVYHCGRPFAAFTRRYFTCKQTSGEATDTVQWPIDGTIRQRSTGRPTGWGRRPHLVQCLVQMIAEGAEVYYSKVGIHQKQGNDGTVVAP